MTYPGLLGVLEAAAQSARIHEQNRTDAVTAAAAAPGGPATPPEPPPAEPLPEPASGGDHGTGGQ